MHRPEAAQQIPRDIRQWDKTVFVALGIADMDALTLSIDVTYFQAQAFAESQAETIDGEIEDPVAQLVRRLKQPSRFLNGDDVRQPFGTRGLDQINRHPGFFQHMLVEEFEALQIELDGTPGVGAEPVGEIGQQLRLRQVMEPMPKIVADAADGARVGINRLGLQAFQFKVLQRGLVIALEC